MAKKKIIEETKVSKKKKGGSLKKTETSPVTWIQHVKNTRAKNPKMSYKEAMVKASKTWKKKK